MSGPGFDVDDPLLAAAAWSRLAEPGDEVAGALVAHLGAAGALAWLLEVRDAGLVEAPDGLLVDAGRAAASGSATAAGSTTAVRALAAAVTRWTPRLEDLDPRRELRVLEHTGGTLLLPGDPRWPRGLDDLGAGAPFALWVRGEADLAALAARSVAVVGARASTSYGEHVTAELAAGLADRGFTVVSGGAYGIDAVAHRASLAAGGATVAVMAGGVDRMYPQGNHALLARVVGAGALVAEVPPGSAPFKQRFLARNRLIAAMTRATVVVEAAWRSGALSTARRAARLLRPVGAVPGPVTSMGSAGCHQLLRDGVATCVTDAAEAAELAGTLGEDAAPERDGPVGEADGLDAATRAVLDALPVRGAADPAALTRVAGLSLPAVLGALGVLEVRGLAEQDGARWRRARRALPARAR
ncbi:DNA-protecting protein DprA [Xylanimonas oleitrophica]|uniref:DNA-protecting protein DprA n=1 Tax=Xylanimonas oleitrophica TaxID=2607479 RepID=A0A2W5XXC4_9MICO|nr:DNA-processing protein DprA [Xylanimonas oleitrophica]PZR55368.1 DNA-protecting protein DprA [Xylanimonas oleitrophica]